MKLHVAIPALDEPDWLRRCLDSLASQDRQDFTAWVCVNQPDSWWHDPETEPACKRNRDTLVWLADYQRVTLRILDRSSPGQGWPPRKGGVGRTRKLLADCICSESDEDDVIVSLDADTLLDSNYLSSITRAFEQVPAAMGIAAPYYHRLTPDETINRSILRYEIYLRYYAINLWRIGSPYAFTALGSGMAFPVHAYHKVGGMPPRECGEDFYFLQKLCKNGRLIQWLDAKVYPATRYSERVPFGTGPAIEKGSCQDWTAYPIFPANLFDNVARTTDLFPTLFETNVETPLSAFMKQQLRTEDPWITLRRNHSTVERFCRACHERLDGLRIFQYLRAAHNKSPRPDGWGLLTYLKQYHDARIRQTPDNTATGSLLQPLLAPGIENSWQFEAAPVLQLDALRNLLASIEDEYRRADLTQTAAGPIRPARPILPTGQPSSNGDRP